MGNTAFTIEINGRLLQVNPAGQESLMDALERVASAYAEEPVRKSKSEPRGPDGRRNVAVTFESGVTLRAYIIPKVA